MENLDPNVIFLWRALERFVNVLIGALAIYLGYKLFMNLPETREEQEGEMKLMLPGDVSVYVSRVGPGIFFGLFGTSIVLMSFLSSVELSSGQPVLMNKNETEITQHDASDSHVGKLESSKSSTLISYVSGDIDVERFSADRATIKRDMLTLRELEAVLNTYLESANATGPVLSMNDANTLLNTLLRVKRSLLLSVWDEDWGDAEIFAKWVQEGAQKPVPEGIKPVSNLFTGTD